MLQDQDQNRRISASNGLETETAVSRTTRLVRRVLEIISMHATYYAESYKYQLSLINPRDGIVL